MISVNVSDGLVLYMEQQIPDSVQALPFWRSTSNHDISDITPPCGIARSQDFHVSDVRRHTACRCALPGVHKHEHMQVTSAAHSPLLTIYASPLVSQSSPIAIFNCALCLHRSYRFGSKLGCTRMAPPRGGLNFLRGGLPFIVLTVGGWLGISHFLSGKFELRVRPCTGIRHLIILSHLQLLETVSTQALHSSPPPMSPSSRCPKHRHGSYVTSSHSRSTRFPPDGCREV